MPENWNVHMIPSDNYLTKSALDSCKWDAESKRELKERYEKACSN